MSLYKLVCVFIWATATGKIEAPGPPGGCRVCHGFKKCCSGECRFSCPDPATTRAPATPIVSPTTTSDSLPGTVTSSATTPTTNVTTAKTTESTSSPFTSSTTCITPQSITTTTSATSSASPTTTSSATTPTTNVPTATTTESTSSPFTSSTTGITPQSAEPDVAFVESSRGSSTAATAAGVSVSVALAVAAVVIVFVLRKKKKLCFAITRDSKSENPDDNHHISLTRIESKPNAHYQTPLALGESEAHRYSVLKKDGFEHYRNDITSVPAEVHDYFVLEKQKPAIGNGNGVSINEIPTYFVLETQGGQPAQEMPLTEANPYFVLEKETTGFTGPKYTAHGLELDKDDRDMYQEIDSNGTYADIDDLRQGNNNYDYTSKAFRDSKTDLSNNVYNHLNSAGDEYDHVVKGQNNVKTI